MKGFFKTLLALLLLVGLILAAWVYGKDLIPLHAQRDFRTVPVSQGTNCFHGDRDGFRSAGGHGFGGILRFRAGEGRVCRLQ